MEPQLHLVWDMTPAIGPKPAMGCLMQADLNFFDPSLWALANQLLASSTLVSKFGVSAD